MSLTSGTVSRENGTFGVAFNVHLEHAVCVDVNSSSTVDKSLYLNMHGVQRFSSR